jgi:acyl-CoA reductase-like NAD-dependent aldehyde dehydrogenase
MASKTQDSTRQEHGVQVRSGAMEKRSEEGASAARLRVNKAYKMYVGGAFIRSESGRFFQVRSDADLGADPEAVNIPRASRKDVRDAVVAARAGVEKWASKTAYNRGQILYRLAEVTESRASELAESLVRSGLSKAEATLEVTTAIDRTVYYAGFTDKIASLLASHNPVSGPHFGFSLPEPTGLVCVVAPTRPALLGLVSTVLPIVAGGNVALALASVEDPRTAVIWSECLATSDMPGGVVNVLTGMASEVAPIMARHRDVNAIDATTSDEKLRKAIEELAADNVKRVKTRDEPDAEFWYNDAQAEGMSWVERYIETKTVWHPMGL